MFLDRNTPTRRHSSSQGMFLDRNTPLKKPPCRNTAKGEFLSVKITSIRILTVILRTFIRRRTFHRRECVRPVCVAEKGGRIGRIFPEVFRPAQSSCTGINEWSRPVSSRTLEDALKNSPGGIVRSFYVCRILSCIMPTNCLIPAIFFVRSKRVSSVIPWYS